MSFEDYIRYIKNINIEEFNKLSWQEKMLIETEYDMEYGYQ